jgi:Ca2+-binding EF-hand superfamily protein
MEVDKNLDNKLDCSELQLLLKKLNFGLRKKEIKQMMKQFDEDNNQTLDFKEF